MTNPMATRTTGAVWPGDDLSARLFLANATGATASEVTVTSDPDAAAPGVWHSLLMFVSHGMNLEAMRNCVMNIMNDTGPRPSPTLLDLILAPTNPDVTVHVALPVPTQEPTPAVPEVAENKADGEAPHARLAREVREMTDLPAATLGRALGVTREQFQRWLKGSAISSIRHGQLIFFHTIVADLNRRVGPDDARVWWRTPIEGATTPEDLLLRRRLDKVHRLVSAIPDVRPIVDGVLQGMPVQLDAPVPSEADDDGSWSPYEDIADR